MILILPVVFTGMWYYFAKKEKDPVEGLVEAQIVYHVCLLAITNVWSFGGLINRWTVFVSWLLVAAVMAFGCWKNGLWLHGDNRADGSAKKETGFLNNGGLSTGKNCRIEISLSVKLMLALTVILFAVLFVGAAFTVPYNYDSMTYHLGRIAHWIDNGSVNHYVTNIDRQIYSPVLSEYEMLHMWLLAGNDLFLNFLQYFSMIFTGMILYKTALKIGTNRLYSMLAAFLFYTMPLTISQSITTQNDLLGTMWFAVFLYYLVDFINLEQITFEREQRKKLVFVGASVAFAFLTKTSICASMLFFMPWLVVVCLKRKDNFLKLFESAALAGVTLLVLISETLVRTYVSCGHLMADTTSSNIMVATKNVKYIIVNILKNYSLLITQHLFRPLNGVIYRFAIRIGSLLQVDFNNEAISYHGFDFLHHMNMGEDMYSHDKTPSAVVAYLALLAGVVLVAAVAASLAGKRAKTAVWQGGAAEREDGERRTEPGRETAGAAPWYRRISIGFAVSAWLSLGFIMALLRWQPWGSRLMYPALAVTVVMIANVAGAIFKEGTAGGENAKRSRKAQAGCLLLAFLSLLFCIRPMIYNLQPAVENLKAGCENRQSRYFRFNDRYTAYRQLIQKTQELGVKTIGLSISGDGYDYPLWLMYREADPGVRLYHVIPDSDDPGQTDKQQLQPECILYVEHGKAEIGEELTYHGVRYQCVYVSDANPDAPDSVFMKE